MKLTIVAATGRIGSQIVEQALAAGHEVTAVARNPDRIAASVRVMGVDLSLQGAADLAPAVQGAHAVLSPLGPRSAADAGVASLGTRELIIAMEATGARRLVVISAAPVGTVASPARPTPPRRDPGDGPFTGRVLVPVLKQAFGRRFGYPDLAAMEDEVRASELAWTIVRPSRLVNKPVSGTYRTAIGRNVRGGRSISRADVAHLMLALIDDPDTIHQTVGISY